MKLTTTILEGEHLIALRPACDRLIDVRKTRLSAPAVTEAMS